jgi:hypothetical protein
VAKRGTVARRRATYGVICLDLGWARRVRVGEIWLVLRCAQDDGGGREGGRVDVVALWRAGDRRLEFDGYQGAFVALCFERTGFMLIPP